MRNAIKFIFLLVINTVFSQQAITDTGDKVGIGTTNPTEKLQVNGNIKVTTSDNPKLSIIGTGTGNYQGASLMLTTNGVSSGNEHASTWFMTHRGTTGVAAIEFQRRNTSSDFRGTLLYYSDPYGWDFRTALGPTSTEVSSSFRIKNTGNIGIGTTNPLEKLQIGNSYTFHDGGHKVLGFMYGASGGADLSSTQYAAELRFDPVLGNLRLGTSSTITNAPTTHMTITKEGYIGIGTIDTKGFKLGVQGRIAAEEVKVAIYSNWADFVFNDNYNLPTLKEVEQHIKENRHLKDIPSAKDVEENGILLGDMNAKLLQKIEELTLYTIDQEKRIEALESKNKDIEKENIELKSLSDRLEDIEKLLNNKNN